MSEIATGVTSSLLTRAADVVLKERRKLVLMVRETPFHTGHLRTMTALSEMGAINHSVGRVLDLFELENDLVNRWGISSGVRDKD
jgi:4-hydroxy-3-polyprenylbenzoate decarboxylase